jgi:hypothetical protein
MQIYSFLTIAWLKELKQQKIGRRDVMSLFKKGEYPCAWWLNKIYSAFESKRKKYYNKGRRAPGKISKYEIARLVYYNDVYFEEFNGTGRDELHRLGFIDKEINNCLILITAYFNGYPNDPYCDLIHYHVDWEEPMSWIVPVHLMVIDSQNRIAEQQEEVTLGDSVSYTYTECAITDNDPHVWHYETWCLPDYLYV